MTPPVRRIPAHLFPIIIEALHPSSGEVLWSSRIEAPPDQAPRTFHIPDPAARFGHVVDIRIRWGDGTCTTEKGTTGPES